MHETRIMHLSDERTRKKIKRRFAAEYHVLSSRQNVGWNQYLFKKTFLVSRGQLFFTRLRQRDYLVWKDISS